MSKRAWGWIAGIGLLALLPLLVIADLRRRADEILERQRRTYEIDRGRWRAQPIQRKPLLGPPIAGNAWDSYRSAFEDVKKMTPAEKELFHAWSGPPAVLDVAAFGPAWERFQPTVDKLREGLRHESIDPGYDLDEGFAMLLPGVVPALDCAKLLRSGADLRRAQGRDGDALDLDLVSLGLGEDITVRGPLVCHLVGIVIQGIALESMRELLASHASTPADLERAAGFLDRLAAAPPSLEASMDVEDLTLRTALLQAARGEKGLSVRGLLGQISGIGTGPSRAGAWLKISRYGFSDRAICAEALNHWQDCRERMAKVAVLPPGSREKAIAEITRETTEAGNPLIALLLPGFSGAWKNTARTDAEMQLARLAVAIARFDVESKAFPASLEALVPRYLPGIPVDPVGGGKFLYRIDADSAVVYSIGPDGDDDGGVRIPAGKSELEGDLSWTLKRR